MNESKLASAILLQIAILEPDFAVPVTTNGSYTDEMSALERKLSEVWLGLHERAREFYKEGKAESAHSILDLLNTLPCDQKTGVPVSVFWQPLLVDLPFGPSSRKWARLKISPAHARSSLKQTSPILREISEVAARTILDMPVETTPT